MRGAPVVDGDARGLAAISRVGTEPGATPADSHPCETAMRVRDGNPKGRNAQRFCAQHDSPVPKGHARSLVVLDCSVDPPIIVYNATSISDAIRQVGKVRVADPGKPFVIGNHGGDEDRP